MGLTYNGKFMKNLKKRIKGGESVLGCWLNLGSSLTAEIIGLAGFDWLLIDLEHGSGTEKDLLYQLQAMEHTAAAPLVRVESSERQRIQRVLDMGAEGVMCPRIRNLAEAEQVAKGLRYPPVGNRGVAKMVRTTRFGKNFDAYRKNEQDEIVGIVQIETVEVLDHLNEIASLEGIDVLFIGPSDLSMELGIFGQFDHPRFVDAVKITIHAARKSGKAAGILLYDPDDFQIYYDMGIRVFASGSDAGFVASGAISLYEKLNAHRTGNTK